MFDFLRSLDLAAVEWEEAVKETGEAAPYTGAVVEKLFEVSQAVVVLLTGDEEVVVREAFREKDAEQAPAYQARPNVFFELGLAFGTHPKQTVIVEMGPHRDVSDILGRNVVRFIDNPATRNTIRERLQTAGCPVQRTSRPRSLSSWQCRASGYGLVQNEARDGRPAKA